MNYLISLGIGLLVGLLYAVLDYMYLFLERCMQLEEARSARKLAVGAE